jgi:hypothetical protein
MTIQELLLRWRNPAFGQMSPLECAAELETAAIEALGNTHAQFDAGYKAALEASGTPVDADDVARVAEAIFGSEYRRAVAWTKENAHASVVDENGFPNAGREKDRMEAMALKVIASHTGPPYVDNAPSLTTEETFEAFLRRKWPQFNGKNGALEFEQFILCAIESWWSLTSMERNVVVNKIRSGTREEIS